MVITVVEAKVAELSEVIAGKFDSFESHSKELRSIIEALKASLDRQKAIIREQEAIIDRQQKIIGNMELFEAKAKE